MKSTICVSLAAALLLLGSGCAHKNVYEPAVVNAKAPRPAPLKKGLHNVVREGAMLGSRSVVTKKSGIIKDMLPKGYYFVNESEGKIIVADSDGHLQIRDKADGSVRFSAAFSAPVVSAALHGNLLAMVLSDNTIVLYDIRARRERYREALGKVIAIDARAANPVFVNDLIVFPTLDGRLLIMDSHSDTILRDVALSDKEFFNNVIFLQVHDNILVAATASKVVVITPTDIYTYQADIKDILYLGHDIYLFTKDGKVIRLNEKLKKIEEKDFEFANFVAVAEMNGKLYGVEKGGYLIEMDRHLGDVRVKALEEDVEQPVLIAGGKLYIGDKVIPLQ